MNAELAAVLDWAFRLMTVFGGWFMAILFGRLKKLEETDDRLAKEITNLSIHLPERYVAKPDFERAVDGLFATLRRIEDKIDRKAGDKS